MDLRWQGYPVNRVQVLVLLSGYLNRSQLSTVIDDMLRLQAPFDEHFEWDTEKLGTCLRYLMKAKVELILYPSLMKHEDGTS